MPRPYADNDPKSCLPKFPQPPTKGAHAIGTVKHHRNRSHFFLNRAFAHMSFGRTDLAAKALRRSASHAVTAAAVNWGRPHSTRRRLMTALYCVISDGGLANGHIRTFRDVYGVTDGWLDSLELATRRLALARLHRRVRRLVTDIERTIDGHRNPPRSRDIIELLNTGPGPAPPFPPVKNIGELRSFLGLPDDPRHASHPVNCLRCRTADPFPPTHGPPT